jgi:RHS repeat-associated protein
VYDFFDHLGNAGGRTNASGAVIGSWDVDMYGNVLSTTGSVSAEDYRHTGNSWDDGAGLYYFNARWYDPETGRFTQRHTPFQPLYEHPYEINHGNPASFVDPTGRLPILVVVPLVGGGIGAATGGIVDGAFALYRSGGDWDLALRCAGQGAIMGGVSGAAGSFFGLVSPVLGAGAGALAGGGMEALFGGSFVEGAILGGVGGAGRSIAAKARESALDTGMDLSTKLTMGNLFGALKTAAGDPFAIGMDAWSSVFTGAVGSASVGLGNGC